MSTRRYSRLPVASAPLCLALFNLLATQSVGMVVYSGRALLIKQARHVMRAKGACGNVPPDA